ncbi:MAG: Gfo/Idh/MocA family oxidoreductase [Lentisphaeria bacterium]|nr:Gfo/Idh/MocA family oxidoreductase [Lentisphaeria bacterium]
MTVGFGIIGAGMIAEMHARSMADLKNAKLIGFYDKNFAAAQKRAEEFGVKAYENFDEFLADPQIRAVTIATPSGMHGSVAIPAARAGKHILCEKPLEITLEKCDEIIRVCDENNVLLSPVFQSRFSKPVQLVRRAMQEGRFGRMVLASAQMRWYRSASYYSGSNWRGTWDLDGGGALMNQAIHMIDLLIHINGAPEEVFAFSGTLTHSIEVEDNLCATVKYRNGSFGTIEVSTSCAPGFPRRLEFSGSCGTVAFGENYITRWDFADSRPEDEIIKKELQHTSDAGGGSSPMNINANGHSSQISDLADAILTGRPLYLDGKEGRRAIELITGIYESARTGKPYFFKRG